MPFKKRYPQIIDIDCLRQKARSNGGLSLADAQELLERTSSQQDMLLGIIQKKILIIEQAGLNLPGIALATIVSSLSDDIQPLLHPLRQASKYKEAESIVEAALETISKFANGELRNPNEKHLTRICFVAKGTDEFNFEPLSSEITVDLGNKACAQYEERLKKLRDHIAQALSAVWSVPDIKSYTDEECEQAKLTD